MRPVGVYAQLFGIRRYVSGGDDVSEKKHLLAEPLALHGFQLKSSVSNAVENGLQVVYILGSTLIEDNYIVYICEADSADQALQHAHH